MKNLIEELKQLNTTEYILIAVVAIVIIAAFFFYRMMKLKKYRKLIVDAENQVNAIKSLPLQYRLGRVQSISKNMDEVKVLYEEFSKEYERITEFQKSELSVALNELDEQLFYGKMRKVPAKMKQLQDMINEYEFASKDLLSKIEKVTEIENIQRIEIIKVKEKYRANIDEFEGMRLKVESFTPELGEMFDELDESFVELEDLMNHQKFEEAKLFTMEIEERIDWLSLHLSNIPNYITVVKQYLPKKIEHINELIELMSTEEFSLHQLDAEKRITAIKNNLRKSSLDIKELKLDNVEENLQQLAEDIEKLETDLLQEKQSYDAFKVKWDNCYSLITDIYNQYKQALLDNNRIKSLYIVDDENLSIEEDYKKFDVYLRESYDLEEELKNGDFAYSKFIEKVDNLTENVGEHQPILTEFFAFRDQLFIQEQRAIDECENINIVLLEIKSEIKNKHLPMINESYKDYIQESYDKAAEIQSFRLNRPVDLDELSKRVDTARDVIYKLYDNVHNLIVTAEMVEEAIVFGNRFRSSFLEVNTELTKAEVLFRNGEYTNALTTAVDIIEMIQPGSYEELIRKSSKKSL